MRFPLRTALLVLVPALALTAHAASRGDSPVPASFTLAPKLPQQPLQLPRVSPKCSIAQTVGISEVRVDFHRPAVKGRAIWGELVPFGEVWRTGANDATTLTFQSDVTISGERVPAGTYAFFAIPRPEAWTLILSKKAKQWGSFSYDAKDDQLRFDVPVQAIPFTEWLNYSLEPLDDSRCELRLDWEKLRVSFPIEVDTAGMMRTQIARAIESARPEDWGTYLTAARYYFDHGIDDAQALSWVEQSIKGKESFWNLELKALLLKKAGRAKDALPLVKRAIELARGVAPEGYIQGLERLLGELQRAS